LTSSDVDRTMRRMTPQLGPEEWSKVFDRLARELPPTGQRRVTLIGGVAMALGYKSRRTTGDADVILAPEITQEVLAAAERIAAEFSLPSDWMNQKAVEAKLIRPPVEPGRPVFETSSLVLEVPAPEYMLAMKVARYAGDTDIADAKILLQLLHLDDAEDVWTRIGGLVPVAKQSVARDNLQALWEDVHEPP
jgi:hypothetical protein